jgi:hypothetical protein
MVHGGPRQHVLVYFVLETNYLVQSLSSGARTLGSRANDTINTLEELLFVGLL